MILYLFKHSFFFFYPEAYTPQNHCTKTSLHRFQWQHCERDRHRSTDLTKANEIPASTLPPTPYSRICHTGPITWLRWDSISLGTKWYNNTCSAYLIEPFIIRQQTQSSTCGNGIAGLGERQQWAMLRLSPQGSWPGSAVEGGAVVAPMEAQASVIYCRKQDPNMLPT